MRGRTPTTATNRWAAKIVYVRRVLLRRLGAIFGLILFAVFW